MNKSNWIAEAIEQNRRATANIPKWVLDSYLPKPQPRSEAAAQPKDDGGLSRRQAVR